MAGTPVPPGAVTERSGEDAGGRDGQPPAPAVRGRGRPRATAGSGRMAALLVSPTLLVLTVVVLYPTIMALRESLYGPKGLDPKTGFISTTEPFVGPRNYTGIFGEAQERFWNAFWNTTFFTVTLETVIGVAVTPPPAEAGGFSLCRVGVATDQPGP